MNDYQYGMQLTIEVVKGGFILQYPAQGKTADGGEEWLAAREVFVSPRKLHQKLKEVIESISLVKEDE